MRNLTEGVVTFALGLALLITAFKVGVSLGIEWLAVFISPLCLFLKRGEGNSIWLSVLHTYLLLILLDYQGPIAALQPILFAWVIFVMMVCWEVKISPLTVPTSLVAILIYQRVAIQLAPETLTNPIGENAYSALLLIWMFSAIALAFVKLEKWGDKHRSQTEKNHDQV